MFMIQLEKNYIKSQYKILYQIKIKPKFILKQNESLVKNKELNYRNFKELIN